VEGAASIRATSMAAVAGEQVSHPTRSWLMASAAGAAGHRGWLAEVRAEDPWPIAVCPDPDHQNPSAASRDSGARGGFVADASVHYPATAASLLCVTAAAHC
jgi:hypothetical protein